MLMWNSLVVLNGKESMSVALEMIAILSWIMKQMSRLHGINDEILPNCIFHTELSNGEYNYVGEWTSELKQV